ncbi:MAG: hypothetical protein WCD35_14955, partial [Mycobacteriales bacterium]
MSDHLDTDALADVLAGEARPAHLDACPSCQTALGELAAALGPVATSLAALPEPEPPADLADRIDRALDRERTGEPAPVTAAPTATPTAAPTVVPLTPHRTRWLPALAAVAAVAVVAVGAAVVFGGSGGGNGRSGSTAGTNAASAPTYRTSSTGNDYRRDGRALHAALPALLGA